MRVLQGSVRRLGLWQRPSLPRTPSHQVTRSAFSAIHHLLARGDDDGRNDGDSDEIRRISA
jgi:hypothetical protein